MNLSAFSGSIDHRRHDFNFVRPRNIFLLQNQYEQVTREADQKSLNLASEVFHNKRDSDNAKRRVFALPTKEITASSDSSVDQVAGGLLSGLPQELLAYILTLATPSSRRAMANTSHFGYESVVEAMRQYPEKTLTLGSSMKASGVDVFSSFKHEATTRLEVDTLEGLEERLEKLPNLQHLLFSSEVQKSLSNLSFLKKCSKLVSLELLACSKIKDFSFLKDCSNLTSLNLAGCWQIKDFSFLKNCPNLASLNLAECRQIKEFSFLRYCPSLVGLNLEGCWEIKEISFLRYCPNLTVLNLSGCYQIMDFSLLKYCFKLVVLYLCGCYQINDASFIKIFPNLDSLHLSWCYQIKDFLFLQHNPNLTSLNLRGCSQIPDNEVLQLYCPKLASIIR